MRRRGFTLLEVLVSLTLVGLLAAGIGLALRTGLDASARLRERSAFHAEARAAVDVLATDLGAAFLSGANPEETLFTAVPPGQAGTGQPFLRLTTLSYRRSRASRPAGDEARSDAVRVDYRLEPNPAGGYDLVRAERWLTEIGPGENAVVCSGIADLQLLYLDDSEPQEAWMAEAEANPPLWVQEGEEVPSPPRRSLPRAVQLTLLLGDPGQNSPAVNSADPGRNPLLRAYQTTVLISANGAAPFETQVTPHPQQNAPEGEAPAPEGQPGG
jgi:prepilin-type N-terminal cleavage/methylation domain-containing protein